VEQFLLERNAVRKPNRFSFRGSSGSFVKSINEPFRLLLDVHPIVTLNDLVFVPSS
jgi:hypothetical protein